MSYNISRMKNTITAVVYILTSAILAGQAKPENLRELRILLRSGGLMPKTLTVTQPKLPKPALPKPKPAVDGLYAGWKFLNFPPDVEASLKKVLLRLKKDAPVHYKVATYRVRTFAWHRNRGSFAIPSRNFIGMGERDWKHSKSWFTMAVIHEIQHNNEPGDESEPAACWSGWYYGKKLKCSPFQLKYSKGLALKQGYNPAKWDRNIKVTLAENSKH